VLGISHEAGADEDDFHALRRITAEVAKDEKQEKNAIRMVKTNAGTQLDKPSEKPLTAFRKKVVYF
jgi:hypothetical protein